LSPARGDSAVVRPAMTYAAEIWHSPKGMLGARKANVTALETVQNGGLGTVLGAFKATSTQVLEAESGVLPIRIGLDQSVLRALAVRGIHPLTKEGNARIRRRLKGKRGRAKKVTRTQRKRNSPGRGEPSRRQGEWTPG